MNFKDSNGKIYLARDPELVKAYREVGDDWEQIGRNIYEQDEYASHVPRSRKVEDLQSSLKYANEIRNGEHLNNFTIWQRVNEKLTGECAGFLG